MFYSENDTMIWSLLTRLPLEADLVFCKVRALTPKKSGNPKTRKPQCENRKAESGNQNRNPESGILIPEFGINKLKRKQVLLPVRSKKPSKKDLKMNLCWNKNSPSG